MTEKFAVSTGLTWTVECCKEVHKERYQWYLRGAFVRNPEAEPSCEETPGHVLDFVSHVWLNEALLLPGK